MNVHTSSRAYTLSLFHIDEKKGRAENFLQDGGIDNFKILAGGGKQL